MKFSEVRNSYYSASKSVSDLTRQLSYAGFGIIWIFGKETDISAIQDIYIIPAIILSLTVMFDFFQYLYKTIIWGYYQNTIEKKELKFAEKNKIRQTDDYLFNKKITIWPVFCFFWLKVCFLILGYFFLVKNLITQA